MDTLAEALSVTRERVSQLVHRLVFEHSFSGCVNWQTGEILYSDPSKMTYDSCPKCAGTVTMRATGELACRSCGACLYKVSNHPRAAIDNAEYHLDAVWDKGKDKTKTPPINFYPPYVRHSSLSGIFLGVLSAATILAIPLTWFGVEVHTSTQALASMKLGWFLILAGWNAFIIYAVRNLRVEKDLEASRKAIRETLENEHADGQAYICPKCGASMRFDGVMRAICPYCGYERNRK